MPIYSYECNNCKLEFERIEKVTNFSFKKTKQKRIKCSSCGAKEAKRIVGSFKIGSKVLETTGRTGYQTDELTLGKIADNDGKIPYEYNEGIRKRQEMLGRQKKYSKELNERAKKYKFDPFGDD